MLKLPEFREFQEHVVRVHRRDDEPRHAVGDAAFEQVVAQEGQRRVAGDLQPAGAAAILVHLACGVGRVAIDRFQVIGDVAVREVLQLFAKPADPAVDAQRFVHVTSGPPC